MITSPPAQLLPWLVTPDLMRRWMIRVDVIDELDGPARTTGARTRLKTGHGACWFNYLGELLDVGEQQVGRRRSSDSCDPDGAPSSVEPDGLSLDLLSVPEATSDHAAPRPCGRRPVGRSARRVAAIEEFGLLMGVAACGRQGTGAVRRCPANWHPSAIVGLCGSDVRTCAGRHRQRPDLSHLERCGGSVPEVGAEIVSTRLDRGRYLALLRAESARFAAAIDRAEPTRGVPSCPEWTREDLLWHLTRVQWFWGTLVRERTSNAARAATLELPRPADTDALRNLFDEVSAQLVAALAATPSATPVWTWADDDHTAGFVLRRQAHEVLIHRVDAELTAGGRTHLDRELAADGVDEMVRIIFGVPPWARWTTADWTLRVRASDTAHSWHLTGGRIAGVDPVSGARVEAPAVRALPTDDGTRAASATVAASAADLDCLLWNRPPIAPHQVTRIGRATALAAFDAVIGRGVH